jgi:hypothetical protein
MVASIFSPILALLCLGLLVTWLTRDRRGLTLVTVTVVGQLVFLLVRVPPLDDRFVLTLAPALILGAALGWHSLPASPRLVLGSLVLLVGLAVGLDFHFGNSQQSSPTRVQPGTETFSQLVRWGLADSADQRGWVRRDTQPSNRSAAREQLWAQIRQCDATNLRLAAEDRLVGDSGDVYWFRYRVLYAALEEEEPPRTVPPICNQPPEGQTQLAMSGVVRGHLPRRPRCIDEGEWELERILEVPLSRWDVAIWAPVGASVCPALGPGRSTHE